MASREGQKNVRPQVHGFRRSRVASGVERKSEPVIRCNERAEQCSVLCILVPSRLAGLLVGVHTYEVQ